MEFHTRKRRAPQNVSLLIHKTLFTEWHLKNLISNRYKIASQMNKALAYEKVFAEVTTSVSIKLTGRWKKCSSRRVHVDRSRGKFYQVALKSGSPNRSNQLYLETGEISYSNCCFSYFLKKLTLTFCALKSKSLRECLKQVEQLVTTQGILFHFAGCMFCFAFT